MIDYPALDALLRKIEAEVQSGRPSLPLRRLRVKEEGPFGKVIAWSHAGTHNEDLDPKAARSLLDSRLVQLGLRTGPGSVTSDDDGSVLQFWDIEEL
jgi:hypothetical protein